MNVELYKATMDVVSEAIKILGPAIITAIVGYKVGQSQLLLKIEELNKNNEFKAREKIFDFHKERLSKVDESIASLTEGLGQFAGMTLADMNDEMNFSLFINKYIVLHLNGLPFHLNHIKDELIKYPDEFNRELVRLDVYIRRSIDIRKPKNTGDAISIISELIEIYDFASNCISNLIEKEALKVFKPYICKA